MKIVTDKIVELLNKITKLEAQAEANEKNLDKLAALENGGVDNWVYYDVSLEEWRLKYEG